MQEAFSFGVIPENQVTTSDDYYTPPWVFEALGLEFDTDPASPVGGIPWLPVKTFYTIWEDGLAQEWKGRVWLNPPFSSTAPWIDRFIDHGNGITLVPLSKSRWFNRLFNTADGLIILPPNLKFITPKGIEASIFIPIALFAIGADNLAALNHSSFGKVR